MKFKDVVNITPGSVIPADAVYPVNARIEYDSLYLRDKQGNRIEGRQTDPKDEIAVVDIDYSTQLALIQYPGANNEIIQGYVTNNTRIINYMHPYTWHNGSTKESVYLNVELSGNAFGTIDAYESATLLHEDDGKYYVAYDAPDIVHGGKSMLNKCGFVRYNGTATQPFIPSEDSLLNVSFNSNVEVNKYGTSWLGKDLKYYKMGNGSNILFAGFAMHGFEDDWDHDGTALVHIANQLIEKISNTSDLHGWTVYIANCMNPDGVFDGITNDGPGRCTVGARMDMNRSFPVGYERLGNTRNYTGTAALQAQEAKALYDLINNLHKEHINGSNQMVVLDFHGWMGFTQGNGEIGKYFDDKFGYDHVYEYHGGFFTTWAESLSNTRAMLLEYPVGTRGIPECDNRDYVGKTYNGIMELLADNKGNGSSSIGWQQINGKWYYFNAQGTKETGWQEINSKWYYLNDEGIMQIGWIELNNKWYYLNSDGSMHTGWFTQSSNGQKFYFGTDGAKYTGTHIIDGVRYTFDDGGVLYGTAEKVTPDNVGWKQIDGTWYYFDTKGIKEIGWQEINNKWYYFNSDGSMHTGWFTQSSNGQKFYFGADGAKYTGAHIIGGVKYTFDNGGVLYGTPEKVNSNYVGWKQIEGKWYYFNAQGIKQTGWQEINSKWYYLDNNGIMQTGWVQLKDVWYYLNSDGSMATNTTIGNWRIDANGVATEITQSGGNLIAYDTVGQVNNNASSVHVRKGAGTGVGCDIITSVNSGELLMIIGKTQPDGERIPWYEIKLNGQELYIRSDFVNIVSETKMQEEGTVASTSTDYVHVRYLPGIGSECTTLDTLYNGTKVEILGKLQPQGQSLPWYRVKYVVKDGSTKIGFIRTDLVRDSGGITPDTNPSDIQNPKYVQIAKSLGFDTKQSLKSGILTQINSSQGISFQATAIVLNEKLSGNDILRVSNGSITNIKTNISKMQLSYGKQTLESLVQTLNNGLMKLEISDYGDVTIFINAIDNGIQQFNTLKINLMCISDVNKWKQILKGIKAIPTTNTSFTQTNSFYEVPTMLIGEDVGKLLLFEIIMMATTVAIARGEEILDVTEEFLESLPEYVEEVLNSLEDELAEVSLAELSEELQGDLEVIQKEVMEYYGKNIENLKELFIKKICAAADITEPTNIFRRAFGASGTYQKNILVGNKLPSEVYEEFKGNNLASKFVEQSEASLTNEWFNDLYNNNIKLFEKLGVNKDEVYEELGKLRDMVQNTKDKAIEAGKKLNNYNQPSFKKTWNVENCAEIWAMRNIIILGSKIENVVLKTVNLDTLKYAAPCSNCEVTFEDLLNSSRILK